MRAAAIRRASGRIDRKGFEYAPCCCDYHVMSQPGTTVDRVLHVINDPGAPQVPLLPVGRCIYCYKTCDEVILTKEHIVPDGLGGDLYLPEASCIPCAKMTNGFESHTISEAFRYGRGLLGIHSRKRRGKSRSDHTYLAGSLGSESLQQFVATPDMPWMFGFCSFTGRPNLLEQFPVVLDDRHIVFKVGGALKDQKSRLQLQMDQGFYWRMIAKIAHAFAVAHLGINGFDHCLIEFICNPGLPTPREYIGVAAGYEIESSGHLHWIEMRTVLTKVHSPDPIGYRYKNLAIVRLKLFSNYGSPAYEVIVGEITPPIARASKSG